MTMPIFFIHRGDDGYLTYSLQQAKASNPHSDVILLGKACNQQYCTGNIAHVLLDGYMQSAAEFAKYYKHVSTNSYEYNLFCFQRWFVLRDFMRQHKLQRCCYLDSDVMLYADINNPEFSHFSFEFSWTSIVDLEALDRFCDLTTNYFSQPALFSHLVQYTQQIGHVHYGQPLVSDMVLFALYLREFPLHRQTHGIFDGSFFDGNINHPLRIPPDNSEIESLAGKKKVFLINGSFYCKLPAKNTYIRVNSLHFQGPPSKPYMKYFCLPTIGSQADGAYFDYASCQWKPIG